MAKAAGRALSFFVSKSSAAISVNTGRILLPPIWIKYSIGWYRFSGVLGKSIFSSPSSIN